LHKFAEDVTPFQVALKVLFSRQVSADELIAIYRNQVAMRHAWPRAGLLDPLQALENPGGKSVSVPELPSSIQSVLQTVHWPKEKVAVKFIKLDLVSVSCHGCQKVLIKQSRTNH